MNRGKRVIVCAPRMPEFDREGGARRTLHLVEFLQEAGWTVTYLARNGTGGEFYSRMLRQRGVETYVGPESRWAGADFLPDPSGLFTQSHFDLAVIAFWYIGEHYLPDLRRYSTETRVIVDSIDLHLLRGARDAIGRTRRESEIGQVDGQYAQEMMRELNTYAASDGVLTVSQKEADLITDFTNDPSLAHCVPLMEDIPPSSVPCDERRGILFLGNFRHPPNLEAMQFFFRHIVPLLDPRVLAKHPIVIVGNALDNSVAEIARGVEDVRLVGWVPSVVPYLQQSMMTIAPLLSGAGTKTKIIQSLTVGTPAISTTIGIEGLALNPEEDILVADNPSDFADAIARVLHDRDLWHRLSSSGRKAIADFHGRDAVRDRFYSSIEKVMSRNPKSLPQSRP